MLRILKSAMRIVAVAALLGAITLEVGEAARYESTLDADLERIRQKNLESVKPIQDPDGNTYNDDGTWGSRHETYWEQQHRRSLEQIKQWDEEEQRRQAEQKELEAESRKHQLEALERAREQQELVGALEGVFCEGIPIAIALHAAGEVCPLLHVPALWLDRALWLPHIWELYRAALGPGPSAGGGKCGGHVPGNDCGSCPVINGKKDCSGGRLNESKATRNNAKVASKQPANTQSGKSSSRGSKQGTPRVHSPGKNVPGGKTAKLNSPGRNVSAPRSPGGRIVAPGAMRPGLGGIQPGGIAGMRPGGIGGLGGMRPGGLGGLGGMRGGGLGGMRMGGFGGLRRSDIRLKQDVALLGHLPNGLGLYRYRYRGEDQIYVGVMAQQVSAKMPEAVVRGSDGYLAVNYERLGLRLQTWDEWTAATAR